MRILFFLGWSILLLALGYFGHKYKNWLINKIKNIRLGKG
jgi:hypothetical protein